MIRAEIVHSGDGRWQLTIEGHADPTVCAAVTAVEQSTAIWLEQLAQLVPGEVTFHITSQENQPR